MNIAMTTLSSKILSQDKEYFAELAVDAVLRLKVQSVVEVGHNISFLSLGCHLKCSF
jgi:chaperonin GroEL (HSP60 family)